MAGNSREVETYLDILEKVRKRLDLVLVGSRRVSHSSPAQRRGSAPNSTAAVTPWGEQMLAGKSVGEGFAEQVCERKRLPAR